MSNEFTAAQKTFDERVNWDDFDFDVYRFNYDLLLVRLDFEIDLMID